jgi:tyrosinase
MKKIFLLSSGFVIALVTLFSFVSSNPKDPVDTQVQGSIIGCSVTSPLNVQAISFTPPAAPLPAVMLRKNVYSLTAAEITSLKNGITAMKALPISNPTSWLYQAAIHGTTTTPALPSWNTCHQAGASFFFLAWHRMYCYFFERILRAKSGDPNLTLPYWDYQTNATLHPDYRNSAAGNPLYDGTRSASMNTGGSLPASISTSIDNALLNVPYYDFQGDINGPHGSVHISMGGNMVNVSSAAKDPVFWLHHTNVDRLWEVWLDKCGGRVNPSDAPWLTRSYTFFDETGTAVSMTGSQVVNTATQLNYRYETKSCIKFLPWKWLLYDRYYLIKWPFPWEIRAKLLKRSLREAKPDMLDNFMKQHQKPRFDFERKESPDKLIIEIESVKINKLPEGVVEVYLNLGPNEQPNPNSKSFVGLLDLFEVSHAAGHKDHKESKIEMNASRTARALGLSIEDLKKAEISFFVRGNSMQGREISTAADIKVEGLNFAIEMPRKQ